jgi:ankyrin repeat protein
MLTEIDQLLKNAIEHQNLEEVRLLVKQGGNLNVVDVDDGGETLFTQAIYQSHGFITDLMRLGASPNVRESQGGTPLIYAVWAMNYRLVEDLLRDGADPNVSGFVEMGEFPITPLDAVFDEYPSQTGVGSSDVLNGIKNLLQSHGAKTRKELNGSLRCSE